MIFLINNIILHLQRGCANPPDNLYALITLRYKEKMHMNTVQYGCSKVFFSIVFNSSVSYI